MAKWRWREGGVCQSVRALELFGQQMVFNDIAGFTLEMAVTVAAPRRVRGDALLQGSTKWAVGFLFLSGIAAFAVAFVGSFEAAGFGTVQHGSTAVCLDGCE